MYRSDATFGGDHASRTLVSLPPISAALSSNLPPWTTRRSKSSAQSDESFSAYLHNPSSSSPALDRALDGSVARRYSIQRSGSERRLPPNLDAIGYAQERASPYGRSRVPLAGTPVSLRDIASKQEWEHHIYRQSPVWRHDALPPLPLPRQHVDASPHIPSFPTTSLRSNERSVSIEDDASDDEDNDDTQDSGDVDFDNTQDSQDMSAAEKKKKRRRTNKNEAVVLAAVFEQTAFPDVTTREELAQKLGMSLRSVSIWFQNRRQAMKKRASRFGGVDGIRGATVTAAAQHIDDASDGEGDVEGETNVAQGRLKRWLSLDEVAARAVVGEQDVFIDSAVSLSTEVIHAKIAVPQGEATNKSRAPILDLLQKRMGNRLSRVTSMPSIAAALKGTPAEEATAEQQRNAKDAAAKDLRNVLKDLVAQSRAANHRGLSRSASMTSVPTRSQPALQAMKSAKVASNFERSQSVGIVSISSDAQGTPADDVSNNGKIHGEVGPPQPLDIVSHAPIGHITVVSKDEKQAVRREREIWKRMQSSSSGLSSENTPESDKENVNNARNKMMLDEDGFEDEEKTLRRIAQRRASRQQAKQEHKLSQEGSKYIQEADARLALQKQGGTGMTSLKDQVAPRLPLQSLPLSASQRSFQRVRSDGAAVGRSGLSRVTSLDFEAGRDRAKAAERPSVLIMSSVADNAQLHTKRSHHMRRATTGENRAGAVHGVKRSTSASKIARHSLGTTHNSFDVPMHRTNDQDGRRGFKSTNSMPSVQMPQIAGPLATGALARRAGNAPRESNTRHLDSHGRRPSPASQGSNESSNGASEEWTDGWYGEQRARVPALQTDAAPEWWRSLKRKSPPPLSARDHHVVEQEHRVTGKHARRVHSGEQHDDSGFFGSDDARSHEGDEDEENAATSDVALARSKKGNTGAHAKGRNDAAVYQRAPLTSIQATSSPASSSPLKRGDDRDRLAAETLLAFGSFA